MSKNSAGLVMYRISDGELEVLLVHPGGPFWSKKDVGAWSIPKGEINPGEDQLVAAKREFEEETGFKPEGKFLSLGSVKHKNGKIVAAWAFEGDCEPDAIKSNTFVLEWPPKSGKTREFPEVDRAGFFSIKQAREKILAAEFGLIEQLSEIL